MTPVTYDDILAAQSVLKGIAVRTPLLESHRLNEDTGARVFIKPENLQLAGSFKFRGAYNALRQIPLNDRAKGVVAWSSGNHAQGVAAAANALGMKAVIVMPSDAPKTKIDNTTRLGAQIVFYDRETESREEIAHARVKRTGATLIPSYDHLGVISGQGTVGLEIAEDLLARGVEPDIVLCCCGGGGLIAGSSLALREHFPNAKIYSVEPQQFNDTERSLKSGVRESVQSGATSMCDALLAPTPGQLTFAINKATLYGGLSVSDADVLNAMRYAFSVLKLVLEPGGAVALAALLGSTIDVRSKTVAIVCSGGNVDPEVFIEMLESNQ